MVLKQICRITLLSLSVLVSISTSCFAVSPGEAAFLNLLDRNTDSKIIPLWPGEGTHPDDDRKDSDEVVQNSKGGKPGIRNVSVPSVVVVSPPSEATADGTTILFAPGGGYGSLSLPNAVDLCEWASAIGAHFALLKYRVPKAPNDPGRHLPLSDAQRAVRLLRANASELDLDPRKIIMVGSSAGGHLAFNLGNNHGEEIYSAVDALDDLSARPNAALLLYPAYLTKPTASLESDPYLNLSNLSPKRTSPVFMTVTRPDKFTWGAIGAMLKLRKAMVPSELHVYPEGGHGGCFNKYPLMEFVRPASRFLKDQGVFTSEMEKLTNEWIDAHEAKFLERRDLQERSSVAKLPHSDTDLTDGDRALAALRDPPPTVIPIWPGNGKRDDDPASDLVEELPEKGDGIVRVRNVSRPTMHLWRPKSPDGRAVIVFPGGGYNGLAAQHEGTEIAEWLNGQGVTAFVTKYRVPRRKDMAKHAAALQDAQRTIRIVRSRADEFGIDRNKIGVLGFSAGGNLAALTVHQATAPSYDAIDVVDDASARPDFAVLVYPAYLALDDQDAQLDPSIQALASRGDYPPIYLAVAADDRFAPGSLHYLLHLHRAKVPGELHVYASGGHGKGLRATGGPFAQWTDSCERWLNDLKYATRSVLLE